MKAISQIIYFKFYMYRGSVTGSKNNNKLDTYKSLTESGFYTQYQLELL